MYPSVLFPVFLSVFFTLHSHITPCWLRKSGEKSNSKHSWSCWTVGGVKKKPFGPLFITGNNKPAPAILVQFAEMAQPTTSTL
jgi:hypothetical protein